MSSFWTLVRVELRDSARAQRPFGLLIVASIGVILMCNGVIGAGVARFTESIRSDSALNLIELSSSSASGDPKTLTDATLISVGEVQGVESVHPWIQIDLSMEDPSNWPDQATNPGAIWATPLVPGLEPELVDGRIPNNGLGPDEILLPSEMEGGAAGELLGKEVEFTYTKVIGPGQGAGATITMTVVGLFDNSVVDRDGPQPGYVNLDMVRNLVIESGQQNGEVEYRRAFVEATNSDSVLSVQQQLADDGFLVSSVAAQLRELGGVFRVLAWTEDGLTIFLGIICLAIGAALGSAWVNQRKNEIGLLRALGWSGANIASALATVALITGFTIAVAGVLLGVVGSIVASGTVSHLDLALLPVDPWVPPNIDSIALALILPPLCLVLGGSLGVSRAVRLEPDEALRDYG